VSGKVLLDTNIIISLFAEEKSVLDSLNKAEGVFVPSIVIGELNFGARKSTRVQENLERINIFVASNVILSCDAVTAFYYGRVKEELRQKGKPIPENDIWVAAIALQYDLTLITRDEHFKEVAELTIESW